MIDAEISVATAEEMREFGRRLGCVLKAGDLVILSGGLGAGKTTLTKGIGDGLGVRGPITSPTFVIARVHPPVAVVSVPPSGPALVHVDAYRLGSALELDDLDLDTDLASAVTVVEWGEGLAEGLSADRVEITIASVAADGAEAADAEAADAEAADAEEEDIPRMVRVSAVGERWEGINLPLLGLADRL